MTGTTLLSMAGLLAFAALYAPAAGDQDHALLSAYQGSAIDSRKAEEFGEYRLVTGRDASGEFIGELLQGRPLEESSRRTGCEAMT